MPDFVGGSLIGSFYDEILSKHSILRKNNFTVDFQGVGGFDGFNVGGGVTFRLADLRLRVQDIDSLPGVKIDAGGEDQFEVTTFIGTHTGISTNSTVKHDVNSLSINFIDLEDCLFEKVFVPWMETAVYRSYRLDKLSPNVVSGGNTAHPRADILVDVFKADTTPGVESGKTENDIAVTYRFSGAYPALVGLPKLGYGAGGQGVTTRQVKFAFNKLTINPGKQTRAAGVYQTGGMESKNAKKTQVAEANTKGPNIAQRAMAASNALASNFALPIIGGQPLAPIISAGQYMLGLNRGNK